MARLDPWNYPCLTPTRVQRIAESMIPERLRPYYCGCDIMCYDLSFPMSAWNTDIILNFLPPVVSNMVDGVRYAHCDLEHMQQELEEMGINPDSVGDEEYAEYDEDMEGREVAHIRDAKPILDGWKKKEVA